jgi:hypothetical protein
MGEKTRVVHVNSDEWKNTPEEQRIYIGRAVPRRGFKASKWANPFVIGRDGTREEVVKKYQDYLEQHPELVYHLEELRDKTLGCWCGIELCHGDVLVALLGKIDRGLEQMVRKS